MVIRHVAAAALLVCASVAHADPISATSAPAPSFLNNWTTGNGTDVLGSGVLGSGNVNLVGGVSYGSSSNAGITDALLGKATGNLGQANGQGQLFVSRGVEGSYLLAGGNAILAATVGDGKSVIGTADGALVVDGVTGKPGMTGGGNMETGGNGGGGMSGDSGSGGQTTSPGSGSSGSSGDTSGGGTNNGSNGNSGSNGNNGNNGNNANNPVNPGEIGNPGGNGNGNGGGNQVQLPDENAVDPAEVPEPSSIALMLAGMVGAGALGRRRSR